MFSETPSLFVILSSRRTEGELCSPCKVPGSNVGRPFLKNKSTPVFCFVGETCSKTVVRRQNCGVKICTAVTDSSPVDTHHFTGILGLANIVHPPSPNHANGGRTNHTTLDTCEKDSLSLAGRLESTLSNQHIVVILDECLDDTQEISVLWWPSKSHLYTSAFWRLQFHLDSHLHLLSDMKAVYSCMQLKSFV